MPSAYVETTIPSYLAAVPSRDLIIAARQQVTRDWWQYARGRFDLYVSEAVLQEIRAGDAATAAKRIELVEGLTVLDVTKDVDSLVEVYQRHFGLPQRARTDIVHIAVAVAYEVDYVVSWNCKHIANGQILRRLIEVNQTLGRFTPLLYTPAELLEVPEQEGDTP
jgi:predicted nucleic acid-binding protein